MSSARMDEVVLCSDKPGIVSIIHCGPGTDNNASASLRHTLSARKCLDHSGFCPMKKADEEEDTLKKDVEGCGGRNNTWGSILFHKVEDSKSLHQPYTHPLVKRCKSMLSTQSLEICTESLGSETGSDGFSASEVGDMEAKDVVLYEVKYAALATRKTRPQSFPPPIQTLSQGSGGRSLSMYSRRDSGRLVVEAVSLPPEKNFEARREGGRLVLTFATSDHAFRTDEEEVDEEEDNELEMEMDEDIFEEMGIKTAEFASESFQELCSRGMINVQKLATLLNEPATSIYKNSTWLDKYYQAFNYEEEKPLLLEHSLSTPLKVTTPATLNAYKYLWRKKSSTTTSIATTGKASFAAGLQQPEQDQPSVGAEVHCHFLKTTEL